MNYPLDQVTPIQKIILDETLINDDLIKTKITPKLSQIQFITCKYAT